MMSIQQASRKELRFAFGENVFGLERAPSVDGERSGPARPRRVYVQCGYGHLVEDARREPVDGDVLCEGHWNAEMADRRAQKRRRDVAVWEHALPALPHRPMSDGACSACALFECAAEGCGQRMRGYEAFLKHDDEKHGGCRVTALVVASYDVACPAWWPSAFLLRGRNGVGGNESPSLHFFAAPLRALTTCRCGKYHAKYAKLPEAGSKQAVVAVGCDPHAG